MLDTLRRLYRDTVFFDAVQAIRARRQLRQWARRGRTGNVPHVVKERALLRHARDFDCRILVETGTFHGFMVSACRRKFEEIHSIELDERLWKAAVERFRRFGHIHVHLGNSADVLPRIVPALDRRTLFWLDAHYSGGVTARGDVDTPIEAELRLLLGSAPGHVILIDDAHEFVGRNGYPEIGRLTAWVADRRPDLALSVEDNMIRIVPRA